MKEIHNLFVINLCYTLDGMSSRCHLGTGKIRLTLKQKSIKLTQVKNMMANCGTKTPTDTTIENNHQKPQSKTVNKTDTSKTHDGKLWQ